MLRAKTGNSVIARNSILNFSGQLIPLIVGVCTIPFVVRGLGTESFGILSLAWMLLGYLTIFDLGMGRATTKFISEGIGSGSLADLRSIFWTSCWMNFFLGIIGGTAVVALSSFLAENVFRISPGLITMARNSFIILAISCPIVLVSTAFRGALEAAQRFEYVNVVAIISSSLVFILPVVGIYTGLDVRGIVLLLMISRLCSAIAYFALCIKVFPVLKTGISFDRDRIRRLLKYGGWVSVSNFVNPILTYLDRFLIGSLISVAAVTFYTAPYEMVSRLSILPTSLAMTLFPSFSAASMADRGGLTGLYARSTKFLLLLMGPLVALLVFFARDVLRLWLGPQFAEISTVLVQILTIGVLMNALAQVPYALIQGFGHPDVTAKFHMLELLFYVPLVWFLVKNMGIVGGALAWTIRVSVDSLLLYIASVRFMDMRNFFDNGLKRCIALVFLFICILFGFSFLGATMFVKMMISGGALILFVFASWWYVLEMKERQLIGSTVYELVNKTGGNR